MFTECTQQWTFNQVVTRVETAANVTGGSFRLRHADGDHLPRVIPLIGGTRKVQPLVTLQSNEISPECRGEDFGYFGFADSRFALQQQRTPHIERQEYNGSEIAPGDVIAICQQIGRC